MNTAVTKKFSVKPLVAAVALSVSAGTALAAPAPFQLMGHGLIVGLNPAATGFTSPGAQFLVSGAGKVGDQIFNGFTGLPGGIQIEGAGKVRGIIQWGGWDPATTNAGVDLETVFPFPNPAGFNIGRFAATTFTSAPGVTDAAILNIDASGSPSFIMGSLNSCAAGCPGGGGGGAPPRIFVSNMNGITVGPEANVVMPSGIGLIGANLNNSTAKNEFLGNNATLTSFIDITDGQSRVEVNGFISGNQFVNNPAPFVLLAGGDIVNTGVIFGNLVTTVAGMRAVAGKATVNLVPGTVVNRFWDVDADDFPFTTLGLGATGGVEIASLSSVVNTGSISVTAPGASAFLSLSSAGFRNGTQGNTDASIGIFADFGVFIENYTAASKVEVYNSVKGYDVNVILPIVEINTLGGAGAHVPGATGDVIIDALTVGTLPSSITTLGPVSIWGANVTINSTINDKLLGAGGVQLEFDLDITGTKSVTINKAIGAGHDVNIDATGPITTAVGGNILSDTNKSGAGGINITNDGNQSGNLTLIAGNLATSTVSGSDINVFNNGISSSQITISGNVTTHKGGDVAVYSDGKLELSGITIGDDDVSLTALGSSVALKGPITADVGEDNGFFTLAAPVAKTLLYPTALITSPVVMLGWDNRTFTWTGVGTVSGVNDKGVPYAKFGDKPAQQIVTNNLVALLLGNLNAPVAGNSDWLLNGLQIDALDVNAPVAMSISAVAAGPQFVNLAVKGDAWLDSGVTVTPFEGVGLTTGTFPLFGLIGNAGSSIIVNATGALNVLGSSGAQDAIPGWTGGGPGYATSFITGGSFNFYFEWPGGIALKSGARLTTFVPMLNAWTVLAVPFQGQWYEAPEIDLLSFIATSGNTRANFSTVPIGGLPTFYRITQLSPISFGFVQALDGFFLNTYSKAINGAPINNCPYPLPPCF